MAKTEVNEAERNVRITLSMLYLGVIASPSSHIQMTGHWSDGIMIQRVRRTIGSFASKEEGPSKTIKIELFA